MKFLCLFLLLFIILLFYYIISYFYFQLGVLFAFSQTEQNKFKLETLIFNYIINKCVSLQMQQNKIKKVNFIVLWVALPTMKSY